MSHDLSFYVKKAIKRIGINEKSLLNVPLTGGIRLLCQCTADESAFNVWRCFYGTLVNSFPGRAWQGRRCWLQRGWRPTWTWSQFHGGHTHVHTLKLQSLTSLRRSKCFEHTTHHIRFLTCCSTHPSGAKRTERSQRVCWRQRPNGRNG